MKKSLHVEGTTGKGWRFSKIVPTGPKKIVSAGRGKEGGQAERSQNLSGKENLGPLGLVVGAGGRRVGGTGEGSCELERTSTGPPTRSREKLRRGDR